MVDQPAEYDPHETVWAMVDELEKKAFTRDEIMRAMEDVYKNIPVDRHNDE